MSGGDATPEQVQLRDNIRRFMRSEVAPIVAGHDEARTFPLDLLRRLRDFGYLGGWLSENQGGYGIDYPTWSMMVEEAGYHWSSLRTLLNTHNIPMLLLANHASPAQRERFLVPLFEGTRQVFSAITEPDVGSNVAGIQTRADRKGEHYVLNGRKLWITNGAWADFGIVVARTFSDGCDGKLSLFLVERDVSPFDIRHIDMMVLRSTGTAELGFADVTVPAENLLGEEGSALRLVLGGLDPGRLNVASGAVGAAQAALDLAIEHARTRKQFGRPIGQFQLIQKHIVDMQIRVEAADCVAHWMNPRLAQFDDAGLSTLAAQRDDALVKPGYGAFACADGATVTIGALEDHFWRRLCGVLDLAPFDGAAFAGFAQRVASAGAINARLAEAVGRLTGADVVSVLRSADVPVADVVSPGDLAGHPQFAARGLYDRGLARFPVRLAGMAEGLSGIPPLDGAA